jgi:DNA gyrase/topoisomerase IV subunit A
MTNKEKKELKEGEEGSEEKNLEKSIKEQKEVLQALQRDVNTIRGSLQEIRDDFAGLKDLSNLDHQKITRIKSILEKSKIDAELEEALNNGIITEELKTMFESKGLSLSESIHITKEKDNKWVITDGKNYYIIRKEMGELNIYDDKFEMRRVNFVNFWYTLGGSFTTVGFALIGIGFSLWNIAPSTAI